MGAKRVSFASREEAELVTEQIYGGISPLGLPENIKVFIDIINFHIDCCSFFCNFILER